MLLVLLVLLLLLLLLVLACSSCPSPSPYHTCLPTDSSLLPQLCPARQLTRLSSQALSVIISRLALCLVIGSRPEKNKVLPSRYSKRC